MIFLKEVFLGVKLYVNINPMKVKLLAIALIIGSLSACTQRTCPTYAKTKVEKPSNIEKNC